MRSLEYLLESADHVGVPLHLSASANLPDMVGEIRRRPSDRTRHHLQCWDAALSPPERISREQKKDADAWDCFGNARRPGRKGLVRAGQIHRESAWWPRVLRVQGLRTGRLFPSVWTETCCYDPRQSVMIDAYRAGIPGNGKPFPEDAKMAKVHWSRRNWRRSRQRRYRALCMTSTSW